MSNDEAMKFLQEKIEERLKLADAYAEENTPDYPRAHMHENFEPLYIGPTVVKGELHKAFDAGYESAKSAEAAKRQALIEAIRWLDWTYGCEGCPGIKMHCEVYGDIKDSDVPKPYKYSANDARILAAIVVEALKDIKEDV